MSLILENPIAFAHHRLRGGWRSVLLFPLVYALAIVVTMVLMTRVDPRNARSICYGWTGGLLGLQLLLVMFFGGARIAGAIRQDIASKMHESHRLMPVPAAHAVVGYMLGGGGLMIGFGAANVLMGIGTSIIAGIDIERWLVANAILAAFIAFVWTLSALSGFFARNLFVLGVVLIVIGMFSQGLILWVLPALAVLLSPLAGHTVFLLKSTNSDLSMAHALGLGAQAVLGLILFLATARKYHRPQSPAFSPILALTLLAAWVGVSILGMTHWPDVGPEFLTHTGIDDPDREATQMIVSMLSALLLAFLPLGASIRAAALWRAHRRMDDPALPRQPIPPVMMGMMCTGVVLLMTAIANPPQGTENHSSMRNEAIAHTAACISLSLLTIGLLLAALRRLHVNGNGLVVLWVVLSWIIPLATDLIRHAFSAREDDPTFGVFSTCSPIGSLMAAWYSGVDCNIGLFVQLLLALAAGMIYLRAVGRSRRGMLAVT